MNHRAAIIDAYLTGDADPQELRDWLAEDPAHVDQFTAACDTHWQLTEALANADRGSRNARVSKTTSRPDTFRIAPYLITGIAAALLAACGVAVYLLAFNAPTDPQPKPPQPGPAVATLIESKGGTLTTPHGYPAEGDDYGRGEYTLDSGTAEFMLTNAVNVKLRGETRMSMRNDMNVALARGIAEFVVPKNATGFTVHLPEQAKIIDLGTAFSVEVKPQPQLAQQVDTAMVRVSDGRVLIQQGNEQRMLAKGESMTVLPGQGFRGDANRIDLADIIAGGDGRGTGRGLGLSPHDGRAIPSSEPRADESHSNVFMPVAHPMIDGVVRPDGEAPVPVSSTGLVVDGVVDTDGSSWGMIARGLNATMPLHFDRLGGASSLIDLHANKGVTFDLDAIASAHGDRRPLRLTGLALTAHPNTRVVFYLVIDGKIAREIKMNGVRQEKIALPIAPDARFLTVITAAETSAKAWAVFGDAALELDPNATNDPPNPKP